MELKDQFRFTLNPNDYPEEDMIDIVYTAKSIGNQVYMVFWVEDEESHSAYYDSADVFIAIEHQQWLILDKAGDS